MNTPSAQRDRRFRSAVKQNAKEVDHACRSTWGFGIKMWRALDQIVSIGALVLAGYAIDQGAEPMLSLALAASIISGPKIVEWWLVREDYVAYEDVKDRQSKP